MEERDERLKQIEGEVSKLDKEKRKIKEEQRKDEIAEKKSKLFDEWIQKQKIDFNFSDSSVWGYWNDFIEGVLSGFRDSYNEKKLFESGEKDWIIKDLNSYENTVEILINEFTCLKETILKVKEKLEKVKDE